MFATGKNKRLYISQDSHRFNEKSPSLKDLILNNESWYIFQFVRHLRNVEYYMNTRKTKSLFYFWHFLRYKRLSFKLHITIYPNTIGPGLRIYHVGDFIHVGKNVRIGTNCTLQPGVVFGNKYEQEDDCHVVVGDNFYAGLGSKFFGELKIGSNVTVGANAVVTHDIPDNAVVGGIPAKIIRFKE